MAYGAALEEDRLYNRGPFLPRYQMLNVYTDPKIQQIYCFSDFHFVVNSSYRREFVPEDLARRFLAHGLPAEASSARPIMRPRYRGDAQGESRRDARARGV